MRCGSLACGVGFSQLGINDFFLFLPKKTIATWDGELLELLLALENPNIYNLALLRAKGELIRLYDWLIEFVALHILIQI
jgi:hypothetical protein